MMAAAASGEGVGGGGGGGGEGLGLRVLGLGEVSSLQRDAIKIETRHQTEKKP